MRFTYTLLFAPIFALCLSGAAHSQNCPMTSSSYSVPRNATTGLIKNLVTGVGRGTTLVFPAGTYPITDTIFLSSGVSLQGSLNGDTVFVSQTGQSMLAASNVSDINICAIHFDGNNTGGSENPIGAAIFVEKSRNIHITYSLFTNNAQESDLVMYNSDYVYFQGNTSTGPNEFQPVNLWITDSQPHGNIYITDNQFSNWKRNAVEGGEADGMGAPLSDWHVDRNAFSEDADTAFSPGGGTNVALYGHDASLQSANNTIWGNSFTVNGGVNCWAIEILMPNTSIEQNNTVNVSTGVSIGRCTGCEIENNSFSNYNTIYNGAPFTQDGGYDNTEWIGWNVWNGNREQGWPADQYYPAHTYGAQPPVNQPSPPFFQ